MANIYKPLSADDMASTRTLIHEGIPITQTMVFTEANIKNYNHAMFQSVYDSQFNLSPSNHLFDITLGISALSAVVEANTPDYNKKRNIYNQMAQVLVGHDVFGNILRFDADGDLVSTDADKIDNSLFLNFSRLLTKDEIKKGSFVMTMGGAVNNAFVPEPGDPPQFLTSYVITDSGAQNDFRINSPAGEYGILYLHFEGDLFPVGLIFYQAGVVMLDVTNPSLAFFTVSELESNSIPELADSFRYKVIGIDLVNTVEINSSIYFCRANHNDFNYSSNKTYLENSRIRVKTDARDLPVSYITAVGLYSADNELLAVAKLSEPLKKSPANELNIRVRLDF